MLFMVNVMILLPTLDTYEHKDLAGNVLTMNTNKYFTRECRGFFKPLEDSAVQRKMERDFKKAILSQRLKEAEAKEAAAAVVKSAEQREAREEKKGPKKQKTGEGGPAAADPAKLSKKELEEQDEAPYAWL